jgi:hypothetical protein
MWDSDRTEVVGALVARPSSCTARNVCQKSRNNFDVTLHSNNENFIDGTWVDVISDLNVV